MLLCLLSCLLIDVADDLKLFVRLGATGDFCRKLVKFVNEFVDPAETSWLNLPNVRAKTSQILNVKAL